MRPSLFLAVASLLLAQPVLADGLTIPPVITFDGKEPIEADIASQFGGKVVDGRLTTHGDDSAGGQKVYYDLGGPGVHAVAADVTGMFQTDPAHPDYTSGAGLVIKNGGSGATVSYFLFLITKSTYLIRSYANGEFGQSLTGSLPSGVASGQAVRLAAREKDDGAEFFLNGESVGSLTDAAVKGSGIGLIYLGLGDFSFDNLVMNTKGDIGATQVTANEPATPPLVTPSVPAQSVVTPPPLPPPLPSVTFYIGENGKPVGPLKLEELAARRHDGRLTADTLVWRDGMAAWAPAKTVPELASLFQ